MSCFVQKRLASSGFWEPCYKAAGRNIQKQQILSFIGNFVSFQRPAEDTLHEAAQHGNDSHSVLKYQFSYKEKQIGTDSVKLDCVACFYTCIYTGVCFQR